MTPEEFDEYVDGLGRGHRNNLLRASQIGSDNLLVKARHNGHGELSCSIPPVEQRWFKTKLVVAYLWGVPWTLSGLVLIWTPIGWLLLLIGAWPLYRTIRRRLEISASQETTAAVISPLPKGIRGHE